MRRPSRFLDCGCPPVLDHQAAVLHDFDACFGELFRDSVIANAGLKPNRLRFLG